MRTAVAVPTSSPIESAGIAQIARIKGLAALGRGDTYDLAEQLGSSRVRKAVSAMTTGNTPDMPDMVSLIHYSAPTRHRNTSSAAFC
ncbi:hypothetical protein C9413_23210, partial [Rhizobium sp. SEMIA 4085]|uniref:hypothetical protein n=1 Tax=Rhizobium sp. SEMIA 4085 TaxID=2137761 RepID=UPI001478867E